MFSATMPPKIRELARQNLIDPAEISIAISKPSEGIKQLAYLVNDGHKTALISHLIKSNSDLESIIIFSSTKKHVGDIVRALSGKGFVVEGISSDLEQKEREDVLNRFKSRSTRVIVATDVLARGIDIKDVHLVINFTVPGDGEDYIHRIGRTARASSTGIAITLVNEEEMRKMAQIERMLGKEVEKLTIPSEIGISPEWNPGKKWIPQRGRNSTGQSTGRLEQRHHKRPKFNKGPKKDNR